MLEKVKKYLDKQYDEVVELFENHYEWAEAHPKVIFTNARIRGCAVIMFAQEFLDVEYEKLAPMYDEYIEKIYKFQKEMLDK